MGYYDVPSSSSIGAILVGFGTYTFFMLGLSIFMVICNWKIYKKAGKGGWKSIVPIYNIVVLLQIVELPLWYILLYLIPFVNIYAIFKTYIELAHKFNKSTGFGVASVFFGIICLPILAFGKCEYNGGTSFSSTTQSSMNNNYQTNNSYSQNFNNMQNNYTGQSYQNTNVNGYSNQTVNPTVNTNLQGQPGVYQNTNSMNYQQPPVTQYNQVYSNVNTLNNQQTVQTQSQVYSNNQTMQNFQTPQQTSQVTEKTCPYCGTKVDSNASFCFMCGKNIQ